MSGRAYRLQAGESPAAGVRRIAIGRVEQAAERLREAARVDDPSTCIHGARKDLKKLRAVLRLVRRGLGDELYRVEDDRYRCAGRLLSPSRDAEVKLQTLARLDERFPGRIAQAATAAWAEALRGEREATSAAAPGGRVDAIAAALLLLDRAPARIEAWPLERDSWKLAGPGAVRAYRRGRREMRRAAADPSAASMHRWRKRTKDLWYQLRILHGACQAGLAAAEGFADELAEALGDRHDLDVLDYDLRSREPPVRDRPVLIAAIAARRSELSAAAFELGERLYETKPKAFRHELRRGWKQWRAG